MRELNGEEIRQKQLEVLQEFHNYCTSHDLRYSLCAGTLLGAIRHHGYIPWDDDIDVMMPRHDYNQFLKCYQSEKYSLYTYMTHSNYMIPYAKLCDIHTIVQEICVYKSDYGIDIDIFPLDFFPDSIKESEKWSRSLGFWKDLRYLKDRPYLPNRPIWKNFLYLFSRFVLFPIPIKYIVRKIDNLAQKYSFKQKGFIGNMTMGYRMKERNPMADHLVDVIFEGQKYKAINNYDIYLRNLFGNYMELPPENKRVPIHGMVAYWKD